MHSIPPEGQIYALITVIMAVVFLAAMIRLWLLRRAEEKLLKNKTALENQIVKQQNDLLATRQDANAWRAEMQRQFDLFRHMASDQLQVEERRFDDLLQKSREREHSLQTSLDIARQMCAELPTAKARLMQLESAFGIDAGEGLTAAKESALAPAAEFAMSPLPDLNGSTPPPQQMPKSEEVTVEVKEEAVCTDEDTQARLRQLQQQNAQLQQALTAARLRSRIRERANPRARGGKN